MTIKVYIWYPSEVLDQKSRALSAVLLRDVGHVSMEVKNTYISHRPSPAQNNDSINFFEYFAQFIFLELSVEKDGQNENENFNRDAKKDKTKDKTKKYIRLQPVKSAGSTNYEKECRDKKRSADKIVLIEGLNEGRILKYYNRHRDDMYHPLNNNCCTFIANILRESLDCTLNFCDFCSLRYFSASASLFTEETEIMRRRVKKFLLYLRNKKLRSLIYSSFLLAPVIIFYVPFIRNRKSRDSILNYLILAPLVILYAPYVMSLMPLLLKLFRINIPVWTPKLIEEFINRIDDSSEKICLETSSLKRN